LLSKCAFLTNHLLVSLVIRRFAHKLTKSGLARESQTLLVCGLQDYGNYFHFATDRMPSRDYEIKVGDHS